MISYDFTFYLYLKHTRICIYTFTFTFTYLNENNVQTYIYIYMYVYICMYVFACMRMVRAHVCSAHGADVYMSAQMYASMLGCSSFVFEFSIVFCTCNKLFSLDLSQCSCFYLSTMSGGARQRFVANKKPAARDRSRSPHRPIGASSSSSALQEGGAEFREDVGRLFLRGRLSGKDTQQLAASSSRAGACGVSGIAKAGKSGALLGNLSRDIMRNLLKDCSLPEPYMASIPTHDPKTGRNRVLVEMPFMLPHELLASACAADPRKLAAISESPPAISKLVANFGRALGIGTAGLVPIGFHGDGVPHQKHKTVQVLSWNFLAANDSSRLLFFTIAKEFQCKCGCLGRCTLDAAVRVFVWSMKCLATGNWPVGRHTGDPWAASDKYRTDLAGPLGLRAALLQARGDWAWLKELFSFPSWSSHQICWKCSADRGGVCDYTDFTESAVWRRHRLTPEAFFAKQRSQRIERSPLFECPGFSLSMVVIDCLHACDLGVTPLALGNLMWEILPSLGRTRKDQVSALWQQVRGYYKRSPQSSQIQALTLEMLRQPNKGPKLRTKGAETRGLVKFGCELAIEYNDLVKSDRSHALMSCMARLLDFYELISQTPYQPQAAARASRRFCVLYKSLGGLDDERLWAIKPKHHMMQELAEYMAPDLQMSPADFWSYRDEDFVGWIASFAASKGGAVNPASSGLRTIQRWRAWIKEL